MRFSILHRLTLPVVALLVTTVAYAANSATQTVTFSVTPIDELSFSGNANTMAVVTAAAGSAPSTVTDASTRYAITTNGNDRKITAALDQPLPEGVVLKATLAAPVGATSPGAVVLATTPTDVVIGISTLKASGKDVTYELSATAGAGSVAAQTRTITFTVTAGAL